MKAIISDIHGNLHALRTALDFIRSEGIDSVYCLGDIIGYGAFPSECVRLIVQNGIQSILGNHDSVGSYREEAYSFNRIARQSILWTRSRLSQEDLDFLNSLNYTLELDNALLVHSTPFRPENWYYLLRLKDAMLQFKNFNKQVCFVGHSHQPLIIDENGDITYPFSITPNKGTAQDCIKTHLEEGSRYLINVGSIGQPRDRDNRLCFVIYDEDEGTVRFCRLEYDLNEAQKGLHAIPQGDLAVEVTEFLSNRLASGE